MKRIYLATVLVLATVALPGRPAFAKLSLPAADAAPYSPAELDRIVAPIALYPDPLLAQVLAAATYSSDIPDAARWADSHYSLSGDRLSNAIAADHVPWDPSVQALLPFPSMLEAMARDGVWTEELGSAVLVQRADVMDAVQRLRHEAWTYGYLRSNPEVMVTYGPYIEILPVDVAYIPVPYYDPLVVFGPPRPGIVVGTAINYRFGVRLGVPFAPWGWRTTRFEWPHHLVVINATRWHRTWANRTTYVHPYAFRRYTGYPVERHHLIPPAEHHRAAGDVRGRHR